MKDNKNVKVKGHDRPKPRDPKWPGKSSKPGLKTVSVSQHRRSRLKKYKNRLANVSCK